MSTAPTEIFAALHAEPERGFSMLVDRYQEPVYWHIRRMVVNHADAQDAMQETFIRIFKHLSSCQDAATFNAWVYRIASNEALRILSRNRGEEVSMESMTTGAMLMPDEVYVDYSDLEAVKLQKAILALPAKQQLAFNLRYYDDLPYDEIARITGSSVSAAKANYHFAKEKIIQFITSHD